MLLVVSFLQKIRIVLSTTWTVKTYWIESERRPLTYAHYASSPVAKPHLPNPPTILSTTTPITFCCKRNEIMWSKVLRSPWVGKATVEMCSFLDWNNRNIFSVCECNWNKKIKERRMNENENSKWKRKEEITNKLSNFG